MTKDDLIRAAQMEIGYIEKAKKFYQQYGSTCLYPKTAYAGSSNYTKYAYEVGHPNGYAWCMSFIAWLFYHTFGRELGNKLLCGMMNSASTMDVKNKMVKDGREVPLEEAQPADIVFRSRTGGGHVGLVEARKDGQIVTIEGNSSTADAESWNGGEVVRHVGARWEWCVRPDWSLLDWHWVQAGGVWYYQDVNGKNSYGWKKIKETNGEAVHWYYFNQKGQMQKGIYTVDGKIYYSLEEGGLEGALCITDESGALNVWNL